MKHKQFFNLDQATRYLAETVIAFKGKPIFIYGLDSGRHSKNFELHYYDVGGDGSRKYILSDNTDIDMNPIPLGLLSQKSVMDKEASTGMAMRMPVRLMKQGLCRSNTKIAKVCPDYPSRYAGRLSDFLMSKELRDTVTGSYPSYTEAFKASSKMGNVIAFSRRFALQGDKLYYKCYGVPVGTAKKNSPQLDEDSFFLKEVLQEDAPLA